MTTSDPGVAPIAGATTEAVPVGDTTGTTGAGPEAPPDDSSNAVATVDGGDSGTTPAAVPRRGVSWPAPAAMLIALVTRLPLLGYPKVMIFDEVYYATDAIDTLQWGAEHGQAKHPPLGKWLIAGGIRAFGFTPVGWRVASLVAGVLVVGLVVATVRRLTGRNGVAFAVGVLAAADGVLFTSGRLAMLDVFVALFVMLTVWFLTVAWTAPQGDVRLVRWAGVAAVASAGLGSGVKWSAAWVLPIVLGVLLVLDRRHHPAGQRLRPACVSLLVAVWLPILLYLAVWAPRQLGASPLTVRGFVNNEISVGRFHLDLRPSNDNAAPATTWLLLSHPSKLFDTTCAPALRHDPVGVCAGAPAYSEARIESLANPVSWAVCMLAVLGLAVLALLRRNGAAVWLLLLAATQWVPWLANPRESYSFYQSSLTPILLVGAGVVVARGRHRRWNVGTGAVVIAAVGFFALFYPIWTGLPLTAREATWRLWFKGWQ